ncbi:MAG: phosphoribosylanthranilate isomerase [Desulfovibrionaceae bacterium]
MNARMLVKICGLTRLEDAKACCDAGADLLGFVFHAPSRRNADPAMVAQMRGGHARKVGVFVNQGVQETMAVAGQAGLDLIQLHGGQDEAFCRELIAAGAGPDRLVKVFWPERYASLADFQADLDRFAPSCGLMLFDAGKGGGGHGRGFDVALLAGLNIPRPWLLAGGLGPDNVAEVLAAGPHGLDMSSGVEAAPGVKDMDKVRRVIRCVRDKEMS